MVHMKIVDEPTNYGFVLFWDIVIRDVPDCSFQNPAGANLAGFKCSNPATSF